MNRRYLVVAGVVALVLATLVFIYRGRNGFNLLPGPSGPPSPTPIAAPTPSPIPAHEVYVANMSDHSILGFAIDDRGHVAATPTRVIRGASTGLHNPFDVVTDSAERIYVANLGDPPGTASNVTVYSATANGNAQPIRTLGVQSGPRPSLQRASSVTIRPRPESVLVADQSGPPTAGGGRIMEFSVTMGQDDPVRMIRNSSTQRESPAGIGLDQTQRIYVVDTLRPRILIYPTTQAVGFVDLAPDAIIEGAATGLNNPVDAALDSDGNIFVVNRGSLNSNVRDASITVYAAGAVGDSAPIRVIGSFGAPRADLVDPVGIALGAGNRIFLLQGGSLKIFASGATGDPAPEQVISAAINNPGGLSVR